MRWVFVSSFCFFLFLFSAASVFAQGVMGTCGSSYNLTQNICPAECNKTPHSNAGPKPGQYCCGYISGLGQWYERCNPRQPATVSCGNSFATDEYSECASQCRRSDTVMTNSATGELSYCCGYVKKTTAQSTCTMNISESVSCGIEYYELSPDSETSVSCGCTGSTNEVIRVTPEGTKRCCGILSADRTTCQRPKTTVSCGTAFDPNTAACNCTGATAPTLLSNGQYCCGWNSTEGCKDTPPTGSLSCTVTSAYFHQRKELVPSFVVQIPRGTDPSSFFPLRFQLTSSTGQQLKSASIPLSACTGDFSSSQTCTRSFESITVDQLGLTTSTTATALSASLLGQNGSPSCQTSISIPAQVRVLQCGEEVSSAESTTSQCTCGNSAVYADRYCCGWFTADHQCIATEPPPPITPEGPKEPPKAGGGDTGGIGGVTAGTFDQLNIAIFGKKPDASLTTPRGIIGRALPYLFVFGGLTLFVMIIWGGFEMMSGAMNPKNQEAGKQRMTAAIMGFILLFISYWIAQIVEIVLGVSIL